MPLGWFSWSLERICVCFLSECAADRSSHLPLFKCLVQSRVLCRWPGWLHSDLLPSCWKLHSLMHMWQSQLFAFLYKIHLLWITFKNNYIKLFTPLFFFCYMNYFLEKREENAHDPSTWLLPCSAVGLLLPSDSDPELFRPRGKEPGQVINDQVMNSQCWQDVGAGSGHPRSCQTMIFEISYSGMVSEIKILFLVLVGEKWGKESLLPL